MQLTPNFSLEEMVRSSTAIRLGIDNTPSDEIIAELTRLCVTLLEPARSLLCVPMHTDSGYRCLALNAAVGGAPDSAHVWGGAADWIPVGMSLQLAFGLIKASTIPFDQLIIEASDSGAKWIHIALPVPNTLPRRECLAATGGPVNWTYVPA